MACFEMRGRCTTAATIYSASLLLDALTAAASMADMVTDVLVLGQFFQAGMTPFFVASLCVLVLAQASFTLLFVAERTDCRVGMTEWQKAKRRALVFVCVFPFAQFVPILSYATATFDMPRLQRVLEALHVGKRAGRNSSASTRWEEVKNKIHAHRGFLLEAFAEAIPQCAIQLIAAGTHQHFSTLTTISILLSVGVIASKSWVVAWSPHTPTFAFNACCIVADVTGFFASLAWVFMSEALPSVGRMVHTLRGWMFGLITLALAAGAASATLGCIGVLLDEQLFRRLRTRPQLLRGSSLWAPPALVPLLYCLALVPAGVIYLLGRWTFLPLCLGTMGKLRDSQKRHGALLDKLLAYVRTDAALVPRRGGRGWRGTHQPPGTGCSGLRSPPPGSASAASAASAAASFDRSRSEPVLRRLREHAATSLLRLVAREYRACVARYPAKLQSSLAPQELLVREALRVAGHEPQSLGIHQGAADWAGTIEATSHTRTSGAASAASPDQGRAGGAAPNDEAVLPATEADVESPTLKWLLDASRAAARGLRRAWAHCCSSCCCRWRRRAAQTPPPPVPVPVPVLPRVGVPPWERGCVDGTLQAAAGVAFACSIALGTLWLLLTLPLAVLSVSYPLIQPLIYLRDSAGDGARDAPSPLLAMALSAALAACIVALVPLRLSRRYSLRAKLQASLDALPVRLACPDDELILQERLQTAVAAALEAVEEGAPGTRMHASAVGAGTPKAHTACVRDVRFDDDCALCHRKIRPRHGIRLFLDAAFLGPSASHATGAELPHLPEPIRRQIYHHTCTPTTDLGADRVVLTKLPACGHCFHRCCWDKAREAFERRGRSHPRGDGSSSSLLSQWEDSRRGGNLSRWEHQVFASSVHLSPRAMDHFTRGCPKCAIILHAAEARAAAAAGGAAQAALRADPIPQP